MASIVIMASSIGSACLVGSVLFKKGYSKSVAEVFASITAQGVATSLAIYYLLTSGLSYLFTLRITPQIMIVWLCTALGAALTVVISNRLYTSSEPPIVKEFLSLYSTCRPCFYIIPLAIAPFCEEVLFRGSLQGWLSTMIGAWPALIIAATIFTLGHIKALGLGKGLITAAILSVILGIPVALYNTLIPSITIHVICNLLGMRGVARGYTLKQRIETSVLKPLPSSNISS